MIDPIDECSSMIFSITLSFSSNTTFYVKKKNATFYLKYY